MVEALVQEWFKIWEKGNFEGLPLSDDFKHTSPYGTISGKQAYLDVVHSNRNKFLGNRFEIHDTFYNGNKACVRYTMISPGFSMEVSEWFYCQDDLITAIISYYNIEGEISPERSIQEYEN